jgi:hypothetical protein
MREREELHLRVGLHHSRQHPHPAEVESVEKELDERQLTECAIPFARRCGSWGGKHLPEFSILAKLIFPFRYL